MIIDDAEEILARFEATDYIGIVPPRDPKSCKGMFPAKYSRVIDFTHVYEDDEWKDKVEWLPGEPAELL